MSRPSFSDLNEKIQSQIAEQLRATPHPRTVAVERVEEPIARKIKRNRATPDASGWMVANGIPKPTPEHRFAPDRRWRFDYAWPDAMLALEVEGGVWSGGRHTRGLGFIRDMEKYNRATLMGWRVLRCTPDLLRSKATLAMLQAALGV